MLWNKARRNVAIALIVMGLALATYAYDNRDTRFSLNAVRALQLAATVVLIFGIQKTDPLHKDKFMLFWLFMTSFFCTVLTWFSFDYISHEFYYYDFGGFIGCLALLLLQWAAVACVGYFIYLIYLEYVTLTQNNSELAGLTIAGINQRNAPYETKEFPPAYVTPTSQVVDIHT